MLLRCRDRMKKPARHASSPSKAKSVSAGQLRGAPDQRNLAGLQFCFFLSGAAGLVFPGVLAQSLGHLFGVSADPIATVVSAFFVRMCGVGRVVVSVARAPNT